MPHYKDGTMAAHGDLVLRRETHDTGTELACIVMQIYPNSETCNGNAFPLAIRQKGAKSWLPVPPGNLWSITLKDCEKLGEMPAVMSEAKMPEPATVGTS